MDRRASGIDRDKHEYHPQRHLFKEWNLDGAEGKHARCKLRCLRTQVDRRHSLV